MALTTVLRTNVLHCDYLIDRAVGVGAWLQLDWAKRHHGTHVIYRAFV